MYLTNCIQHCPQNQYKYGQVIFDAGCRLTGQKCATNMVFNTVQMFFAEKSSQNIYDCQQRCICAEGYNYIEISEKCFKEVRTFQ